MITNFEDITFKLTDFEKTLVLPIMQSLEKHTVQTPIKEKEIIYLVNAWLQSKGITEKLTGVRFRKIINQIRVHSLQPVIATSRGYFVCYEIDTICSQITSLRDRASAILACADGLQRLIHEKPTMNPAPLQ